MKKLFVAATRQNDGKTTVSLGLFRALQKRLGKLAYMKPVGQQYKVVEGEKIDKDAVLIHSIYNLQDKLSDMSPIAVPRGFTSSYIETGDRNHLVEKIQTSYKRLAKGKDMVLIEGTGHAGVGSVFDMSNAQVAKELNSQVIMVSLGGIGRPIDEILLNKSLFDNMGIEVLGVIVNKVLPKKYEQIHDRIIKGFARHGIEVFGVIPKVPILNKPSIAELVEDLDAELLVGDTASMSTPIGKFVIGDMQPHAAVGVFNNNAVLIVPGNRESVIVTALCGNLLETDEIPDVAAMIFTRGISPHSKIMDLIKRSNIPAMLVKDDSFKVATKINNSIFKLRAEEVEKIEKSQVLVESYVNVDKICELIND